MDIVCCLLPSNPFTESQKLIEGLNYINDWDFVFPVVQSSEPIHRALSRNSSGLTRICDPTFVITRTQDLEILYFDSGQFYLGFASKWSSTLHILSSRSYGMILDRTNSVDIDTEYDWELADFLFTKKTSKNNLKNNKN